jgi:serine/threonine protein kinase
VVQRLPSAAPVLSGFTYLRPLGSGGFADVFLYEQDMPRRQVAVKVLPTAVHGDDVRRMFNAEADVLARLSSHPSILTVYQASVSSDGRPYIVMEFCPGSYGERYRREKLPVPEVLATGIKVASALETAHRAGLVHRDVKPSNILVTEFGVPVLSDFGIAASLGASKPDELFAMSVPWSAPEVISESTSGTVASEVWSLGGTVYSLLAGRSPFERAQGQNSSEQLARRIEKAAYSPTGRVDVPASLEAVLAQSMRRDPSARFGSAMEFGRALQAVQREVGLPVTPLEVASSEWAAGGTAVAFDNTELRGVVRPNVPHLSRRRTIQENSLAGRTAGTDRRTEATMTGASLGSRQGVWPWIAVGVGAGLALVLVIVLVMGWLR